ncbi:phosphoribosylglycinamide formyltransferase, partial [Candidatus Micrarchaeota archaeon]|nr:phosphoribosylglycinamide formyltransferase [Candidatus Micrarchaeota archaeon]
MKKLKIAVLASGRGSNFQAIVDSIQKGECNAQIQVLLTNNPTADAISIAKSNSIPIEVVERKNFVNREQLDEKIKQTLDRYGAELVVLAGYMLLLKGKSIFETYKNRIINIHPSLLPLFPGENAQKQAFA